MAHETATAEEAKDLISRTHYLRGCLRDLIAIGECIIGPSPGIEKSECAPCCNLEKISDQVEDCVALTNVLRTQLNAINSQLGGA